MMATTNEVLKNLEIQTKHEGSTANIDQVKLALSLSKTPNEFLNFVTVKFIPYGKLSYQCHRFYYIKDHFKPLFKVDVG